MLSRKQKLLKLCMIAVCFIILTLMIVNKEYIHNILVNNMIPNIQEKLFPDSYKLKKVDDHMQEVVNLDKSIQAIVLYRFNKNEHTQLIESQEGIAFKNRYPNRKMNNYMYLIDKKNNTFQELLMNKVHFENIYTINSECSPNFNPENFVCSVVTNTKITNDTVITIPVINSKAFEVIGYIMITVDKSYNKFEVETLVNHIKDQIKDISTELNYM